MTTPLKTPAWQLPARILGHAGFRFRLAWLLAIALVVTARHYPTPLGASICLAGATLRFLSAGFLRKDAELAVGGPFAHTRNPLYVGTLVMAGGFAYSIAGLAWSLLLAAVLSVAYVVVVRKEEQALLERFPLTYGAYCDRVPRFFPRLSTPPREALAKINGNPAASTFSLSLAWRNRAYEAYITAIALFGLSALAYWLKSAWPP